MDYSFNRPRTCPHCKKAFGKAEQKPEHDPLVVVVCPGCGKLLWRPGSDEDSELFPYDPNADAGGI